MNYLKRLGKCILTSTVIFIISLFIVTLLNYFNLMSSSVLKIFSYIISFISFFIGSLILGLKSNSKGFLEGLKFSATFIIFFTILNVVLKLNFSADTFVFYFIILLSSMFGSIMGINKQKK